MIGLLRGRLLAKHPPTLLLDVQGVGYEVDAPMTTFYELPDIGTEVILYTHLAVREDAHTLYGFLKLSDRDLFRTLLKVNGVGARLALAILSGMETRRFISCVQEGDTSALVRLPGIGKKTAERPVMRLLRPLPVLSRMRSAPWWDWATSRRRPAAWCVPLKPGHCLPRKLFVAPCSARCNNLIQPPLAMKLAPMLHQPATGRVQMYPGKTPDYQCQDSHRYPDCRQPRSRLMPHAG
jgi:Holliday junction DNA helicase RuvA subunit